VAKLKLKFRDVSRMTKKYPYTRHLPRTQLVSDKEFEMEIVTSSVSSSDEHTVNWSTTFGGIPNVTATIVISSVDANTLDQANVNIWVKSVTTAGCIINFSDTFTGTINVQAIRFT